MTDILFSTSQDGSLEQQVARLRESPSLHPFDPAAVAFVSDFAQRVLKLSQLRAFPELATLAHWFRPAAVKHLTALSTGAGDDVVLARGLVFHMAPANVDVLFAYTWLMSVLCGNRNIARLSQKPSAQRAAMLSILEDMRRDGAHASIVARQVLLTYPHDDRITALVSRGCHARIVWGGDATVAKIRAVALAPLAVELAFPDRFGVVVLKAERIAEADDDSLAELARRFCNDALWFGQQACSSPRTLYWVGGDGDTVGRAKARFWPKVREAATRHDDEPAALMTRLTDAYLLAARAEPSVHLQDSLEEFPLRLEVSKATDAMRELQSGHGLLGEVTLESLTKLACQLNDRDQTLVEFGFDADELHGLVQALDSRAIDRIVPLGRALDFHHIWDGIDLLGTLTRRVTCPAPAKSCK